MKNLEGEANELINKWRYYHPNDREYFFYIDKDEISISHINRIYVRDDQINKSKKWSIEASEILINYKTITTILYFIRISNRDLKR